MGSWIHDSGIENRSHNENRFISGPSKMASIGGKTVRIKFWVLPPEMAEAVRVEIERLLGMAGE